MARSRAREQMVAGTADLLGRRGLRATSVRELAKHSGAPLGSTYHHFPGGKTQMAVEAVQFADAMITRTLTAELAASDPVAGLRSFIDLWRKIVVDSEFRAGCPVLAVSVEEPDDDDSPLRAAASAFTQWIELLADAMRAHGANAIEAERLATLIVASVEGTVAICRAQRSTIALDLTADALEGAVRSAIR
ncbi:TetR/AcrR family transcriptional regulator [Gordonia soli]|uniref:Putative TetR family transcriptional regulator n=1 Tax=Gordonia soli NBRC 108243 TaxID=1223545 RepID=M0QET1_9ACTN|nr:helix-turn-helix domain-containing protein [Gordonia soli]GAC67115.1 putative TetR family transcriptional regulator [Gordonia soli NBRC 108243]